MLNTLVRADRVSREKIIGGIRVHLMIGLCFAIVAGQSACADLRRVLDFEKQAARGRDVSRIEGRIETEGPTKGVLVVILGRLVAGEDGLDTLVGVDSYVRVNSGSYLFAVSPGRFQLGAYEDRNRNGLLDPGERAVRVRDGRILEVGPGERVHFDLRLAADAIPDDVTEPVDVLAIVERTPDEQREFSLWAFSAQGAICEDLDDARFGPASGRRGLWEPMDFLNDGLAGIYFLEPYDPDRIPVLFVHGISGYPQEFETLIDGLDRSRFQAWFYFYPSAFPLDGIARHLSELLERLRFRYHFHDLAIVAHSMGGLVARAAIFQSELEHRREDVRLFITIVTPWSGVANAAAAQESSIELPSSFRDMDPSSPFIRGLFHHDDAGESVKTLPTDVAFHMILGFRMSRPNDVADDGKVTLRSQARMEAQEEARSIRALDYGHTEILRSPELVVRMNALLHQRFD